MQEIRKITPGFVIQRWDGATGKFLGQEFTAGDPVYEDEQGNPLEAASEPGYEPYDMVQPVTGRRR